MRFQRSWMVAMLLVGALLLTGLLAMSALKTQRYQRAQAERVLNDYAQLAAQSYAGRAAERLFFALSGALDTARVMPPDADDPVAHAVRSHLPRYGANWYFALIRLDSQLIVYRLDRRSPAPRIRSFVASPSFFAAPLAAAFQNGPLLPPALAGELRPEQLGRITVRAGPLTLFTSSPARDSSPFVHRAPIGDYFGDVTVEAALRPAAAGSLIIGGLPRSQLPFIATLFALAAALVAGALIQLRRERHLARLRDDFVAGVSHELRTPLAQVRMFAETLLLDRVRSDDERRRSLAIIDQEARRLTHLVDNILHFTRSARVAPRLDPRLTPLAPLLRDVVEGFRPLAASRRTTLQLDAGEVAAPVDEAALRQVLINLLDNAVKYGPDAQQVTVRLARHNGEARLAVEDEGPGIPERDHRRVWERFVRLSRDRGSAVGGSGIGLAVVRELVELHGGRCWIERAQGGGARVVVALPTGADS